MVNIYKNVQGWVLEVNIFFCFCINIIYLENILHYIHKQVKNKINMHLTMLFLKKVVYYNTKYKCKVNENIKG